MLLPVVAIAVVAGMFWAREQAREAKKDPLTKARDWVQKSFGMTVERETKTGSGIKVEAVAPGSAAAEAGIRAGDQIVAVADRSVWHVHQLVELIAEGTGGPVVPVLVATGDDYHLVRLSLAGMKTPPPIAEEEGGHHH
jgi:S1-C subfamily serine protease